MFAGKGLGHGNGSQGYAPRGASDGEPSKDSTPLSSPIGFALLSCWLISGCATGPAPVDIAAEQQRCAAVWRSRGDPDRAMEMQRRSLETRRNEASAHSQDDFLTELLDLIFAGTRSVTYQDSRPYLDPRGCE